MLTIKFRYVKIVRRRRRRRDGTVWKKSYFYFWKPGAPDHGKRLPDDPASPEFAIAMQRFRTRAEETKNEDAPNSFARLIADYRASPEFACLRPRTQRDYSRYLDELVARAGDLPYAAIDRQVVYKIRNRYKNKPRTANYYVAVLRLVLSWAVEHGRLDRNPASGVKLIPLKPRSQVWGLDAEEAFLEHASPSIALAYKLGVYVVQRQADILAMTWAQYRQGKIRLRQQKTGELLEVPCHPELIRALAAAPRVSTHILTSENGLPYKPDHFRHLWKRTMDAAGLKGSAISRSTPHRDGTHGRGWLHCS